MKRTRQAVSRLKAAYLFSTSHCKKVCGDAMTEYRNNCQNDQYSGFDRADSHVNYYYQAHRENPECITLPIPQPLPWSRAIHCVNEIMFNDKPRLVNKFTECIGGIHALKSSQGKVGSCITDASLFHEQQHKRPLQTNRANGILDITNYEESQT